MGDLANARFVWKPEGAQVAGVLKQAERQGAAWPRDTEW